MFAFSRHNYYVQEKLRLTRTPEEQHASPGKGNTDVRQKVAVATLCALCGTRLDRRGPEMVED